MQIQFKTLVFVSLFSSIIGGLVSGAICNTFQKKPSPSILLSDSIAQEMNNMNKPNIPVPQGPPKSIISECTVEVKKFCDGVKSGGGRMKECLLEHKSELNPACLTQAESITIPVKETK